MMRKTVWILGARAVALLLAVSPAMSHDHGKHGNMMFGGEKVDLSDLADGETRTFGEGEHRVTAQRNGDLITIAVGDTEMVHDLTCDAAEDNCFVLLSDDDDAVKLMVTKGGESDGHMAQQIMVMALGDHEQDGDHEMVFSSDDGELIDVMVSTHGEGGHWVSKDGSNVNVMVTRAGEGDPHGNRILLHADTNTLRCPEGDTTMRLQEGDEDDGPFYCPKHDIKLEKMDLRRKVHRINAHDHDDD